MSFETREMSEIEDSFLLFLSLPTTTSLMPSRASRLSLAHVKPTRFVGPPRTEILVLQMWANAGSNWVGIACTRMILNVDHFIILNDSAIVIVWIQNDLIIVSFRAEHCSSAPEIFFLSYLAYF